ncbi:MAG: dihydrolipoyl dehydrogenase, partial [Dehalococcoidia bacterium]
AEILELFHRAKEFGFRIDGLHAELDLAITRSRQVVERMVKGVEFLLRKNGVQVYRGDAYLPARDVVEIRPEGKRLQAKHIILATGARTRELPGLRLDGDRVITARQALELRHTPGSIVIVGGGAVGCEFAYIYRTYGAEVTILEQLPHLLPIEDEAISLALERAFTKQGITHLTSARVVELTTGEGGAGIVVEQSGERRTLRSERVLVGIGVQGNSDGLGLEALGVRVEQTFVPVDERMQTNVPGISAIGDLTGPPLLAHVASAQGINAVEAIAGRTPPPLDYEQMPRATYCQPEVAAIGLTEAQARERGGELAIGTFPFRGNGRALAMGEPDGMAKVIADQRSGEILGIHLIGAGVTELLGEASLARALEATPAEIGFTVHAHPTLSEVIKEAALGARGEAIHVWQGS